MTEKEKAKAYDEAIERVNKLYGNRIAEEIFPELNEDDDEKIRRWIIDDIRYNINNEPLNNSEYKKKAEKAIAWLEKQRDKDKLIQELGEYKVKYTQEVLEKYVNSMSNKDDERLRKTAIAFLKDFAEQGYENAVECIDWLEKQGKEEYGGLKSFKDEDVRKFMQYIEKQAKAYEFNLPNRSYDIYAFAKDLLVWLEKQGKNYTDKIEPKFKVGEWVVNKFGDSWYIDSIDKKNYQVSDGKGNYNYFPISKQDEMLLWNIQNVKDGDVLSFYTEYKGNQMVQIAIIEKYVGKHGGCSNTFKIYVGVDWDNNLQMGEYMGCSDIHPATKEQRDALMKAINDAGYEWDTEKEELKKKKRKR